MSVPVPSRQRILDSIRAATGDLPARNQAGEYPDVAAQPFTHLRRGALQREACLELMIARLREYDAEVVESSVEKIQATIATQLAASGKHIFVAPQGVPADWLATGFDWKIDRNLAIDDIEHADGVLTAAACGVAESGTIVLHHSAAEGRRVLTLLPDWHLCVLKASQVVETLPEYFARCQTRPVLVTTISGPSATADIEMTRIKGVHGPRFMNVILVRDDRSKTRLN